MQPTAMHHEVEDGFRRLLQDNDLPAPDGVSYEDGTVWFYWHDRKVAIAVDFEGEGGELEFLLDAEAVG